MLNRLMLVYFIQKKGFLDNNPNSAKPEPKSWILEKLAQPTEQSAKFDTSPNFFDILYKISGVRD